MEPEELVASWTLLDGDWALVANKAGAIRLGFALLLEFFELEARFRAIVRRSRRRRVAFVADQVAVSPTELAGYDWARLKPRGTGFPSARQRGGAGSGRAVSVFAHVSSKSRRARLGWELGEGVPLGGQRVVRSFSIR